ncbi:hypothetical protein P7K49_020196 [Saguinus oedipus]|uniref:Uncharacterized protein n=1 Tax=Saguinus oedipus TaxID=9490 RepID=A0ABQ9UZJ3_SAGOE|nr:hypothetical protein P7K49_020196 [Saguinus oedipus]
MLGAWWGGVFGLLLPSRSAGGEGSPGAPRQAGQACPGRPQDPGWTAATSNLPPCRASSVADRGPDVAAWAAKPGGLLGSGGAEVGATSHSSARSLVAAERQGPNAPSLLEQPSSRIPAPARRCLGAASWASGWLVCPGACLRLCLVHSV